MTREYRIVETGETTRDELTADDAHCRGRSVHCRDHGPHDETPLGPWWIYGTVEFADAPQGHPASGIPSSFT